MNEEKDNAKPEQPPEMSPPVIDTAALVHQLEDLVKLALECEKKELAPNISFADVNNKLRALRETIENLNISYQKTLQALSLTDADVVEFRKNILEQGGPEKKLLDTLNQLQTTCEQARDRVNTSLLGSREQIKDFEAMGDEDATKKRRKSKFKSMGGRKGWLPT